jgi:hypothetical protein
LYDLRHLPPGKYSAEVAHHMDWTGKSFSLPEFEIEPSQVTAVDFEVLNRIGRTTSSFREIEFKEQTGGR